LRAQTRIASPSSQNEIAFDRRLTKTCASRLSRPSMTMGSAGKVGDELDPLRARLLAHEVGDVGEHLEEVEGLLLLLHQFAVEPRGVRDVGDQPVEAAHVVFDHVEELVALVGLLDEAQRADGRPQRGERVLDLVRHVGRELLVRVDPVVERRDHAAQRAREPPDLVGPGGQVGDADAAGGHLARAFRSRPISAAAARSESGLAMVEASTRLRPMETSVAMTNICSTCSRSLRTSVSISPAALVDAEDADDGVALPDRGGDREDRWRPWRRARADAGFPLERGRHEVGHDAFAADVGARRAAGGEDGGDDVPDAVQEIGDDRGAVVALEADGRRGGSRRGEGGADERCRSRSKRKMSAEDGASSARERRARPPVRAGEGPGPGPAAAPRRSGR
jgi:hypothetical protein